MRQKLFTLAAGVSAVLCVAVCVLTVLLGRARSASPTHTAVANDVKPDRVVLTFTNYSGRGKGSDPEAAIYYLDAMKMGQGTVGFRAAFERMKQLPRKSVIVLWFEDYADVGIDYDPPYHNYLIRLFDLAEEKDFTVGQPEGPWLDKGRPLNPRFFTY